MLKSSEIRKKSGEAGEWRNPMNFEIYRCAVCGNVAALLNKKAGPLQCCGKPMTLLTPNTTDAAQEKHVPVVSREGGQLKVKVGSTAHPMLPEHYIEWIALIVGETVQIHYLAPGEAPETVFADAEHGTALAYCNLHGLWAAEF